MAPPLAGGAFNANWNGLSLGDLVERIRISMPQNSPNSLSRQQYVDILAVDARGGRVPGREIRTTPRGRRPEADHAASP